MGGSPDSLHSMQILNWGLPALSVLILLAILPASNFSLELLSFLLTLVFCGAIALLTHLSAGLRISNPKTLFVFCSLAQLTLVIAAVTPITYVAAARGIPLYDQTLLDLDTWLGFNALGFSEWTNSVPLISEILNRSYDFIGVQTIAIPVVLGCVAQFARLQQFVLAFSLALGVTAAISAVVPAQGFYSYLGIDITSYKNVDGRIYVAYLDEIAKIRNGLIESLSFSNMGGVVTFPSFHAASAIIFAWALWHAGFWRAVAVFLNGAMYLSSILNGGHYVVDLVAGSVVAVVGISVAKGACLAIDRRARQGSASHAIDSVNRISL